MVSYLVNISWVDGGDLLYWGWYLRYGPLVYGYQIHGNLENCGNGDNNHPSKYKPSNIAPSFYSNELFTIQNPNIIGSIKGKIAPLFPPYNQTTSILKSGMGSSGDNSTFGIR